jgi:hypothetical protein
MALAALAVGFHDRLHWYGSTPFAIVTPELLPDLDKSAEEIRAAVND